MPQLAIRTVQAGLKACTQVIYVYAMPTIILSIQQVTQCRYILRSSGKPIYATVLASSGALENSI